MSDDASRLRLPGREAAPALWRGVAGGLVLLAMLPAGAESAAGRGTERRRDINTRGLITARLELSISRGLKFLARKQRPDGTFGSHYPVASISLAGLAFLAGGYTPGEGPFRTVHRRAIDRLLSYQRTDGYFDDGQRGSRMYGHGFATLFLAELVGMSGRKASMVEDGLRKAIRLIEVSQGAYGGWNYHPRPGDSDSSITVCQTMALRAARNMGIRINPTVIEKAQRYIRLAQKSDGGFRYKIGVPEVVGLQSDFARSAAGVCILYGLGNYYAPETRKGLEYIHERYRSWHPVWPYYAHYYAAQAFFQAGGRYWAEYFPWVRDRLLRKQEEDGGWHSSRLGGGRIVATAMALIILEIPYQLLPILER